MAIVMAGSIFGFSVMADELTDETLYQTGEITSEEEQEPQMEVRVETGLVSYESTEEAEPDMSEDNQFPADDSTIAAIETEDTETEEIISEEDDEEVLYATDESESSISAMSEEPAPEELGGESESSISAMSEEPTSEELVGASSDTPKMLKGKLQIQWQDGYVQTIALNANNLSTQGVTDQSKNILKTMGLPKDTYRLTVVDKGATAVIRSRNFYNGDNEVRVLAHMGYHKTATRNTLSSYRVARALGFHYVGGDIRFTRDNIPVVVHDATINATARNADGSKISQPVVVREHTYKELLKYDFGLSTNAVWKGEKIPTLEEYMVTCRELGVKPNIHIKTDKGLTVSNFESVADIVLQAGMQGKVTYAANVAYYLRPIIKKDPISLIDIVITDKWTHKYLTDALSLKTGRNKVELALSKKLYTHDIAATCRFNKVLITCLANSEAEAAALDAYVDEISTDGALPDVIIRGARKRKLHGGYYTKSDPKAGTDYQIRAHADAGVLIRTLASMPCDPIRLNHINNAHEVTRFRFVKRSDGYYNIISSRNCFSVGVKKGWTGNGVPVYMTNWNMNYNAQKWRIVHNDDGSVSFINKHSGKALHVAGDKESGGSYFNQSTFDGRSSQRFWLIKSPSQTNIKYMGNKVFLQTAYHNIVVSTKNGSTAKGANVTTAKKTNADIQKYRLLYSGDGYYRIENVKTGYCLTIEGSGTAGNIVAKPWANTSSQRWKLVWTGRIPGTYCLMSKKGGTCVTIGGAIGNSTNIIADWWHAREQQQWKIVYDK
jgi:glycerophosphoryl diester phosphodiesterase